MELFNKCHWFSPPKKLGTCWRLPWDPSPAGVQIPRVFCPQLDQLPAIFRDISSQQKFDGSILDDFRICQKNIWFRICQKHLGNLGHKILIVSWGFLEISHHLPYFFNHFPLYKVSLNSKNIFDRLRLALHCRRGRSFLHFLRCRLSFEGMSQGWNGDTYITNHMTVWFWMVCPRMGYIMIHPQFWQCWWGKMLIKHRIWGCPIFRSPSGGSRPG